MIGNKEIIKFFSSKEINTGFIDLLKIKYRPLICPFNKLLKYAKNAKSVFDIGCGSGQFISLIAHYTEVNKIKGIEINSSLIKNAGYINNQFLSSKEISFALYDGHEIPNDVCEYDLIYLIDVYHHVPKKLQKQFIFQVFDKMKKGSRLIFKDIDASSPLVIFNKMHDLLFSKEIGNEISLKDARVTLKNVGFSIIEEIKITTFVYPHYLLVAQKDK